MATIREPVLPPPTSATLRKTVAVVDMVAYGAISKILEENIGPASVTELNRQIQSFIAAAIEQLPDQRAVCVVTRTGDGIILLFDHAQDAHTFARDVLLRAQRHNDQRTERTAQRWFRIGIATGEISTTACTDRPDEFAGTVIANAVRLEGAANPGAIIIDSLSFLALTPESKLLYSRERIVEGKRKETFKARCYRVTRPRGPLRPRARLPVSRRTFLGAAAATVATSTLAAWLGRDRLYAHLHPLPDIRHIALMAWPPPAQESEAMLAGIIDSIHARLIHAEAYTDNFMIVTAEEVARTLTSASSTITSPGRSPQEAADQWGANLILAANLTKDTTNPTLELRVLDTTGNKLYRQARFAFTPEDIARTASDSAARLLDLPIKEIEITDEKELANQTPAARILYAEATLLAKDPNHTHTAEALQKFLELAETYANFSLAHSGLAAQYLSQFKKARNPTDRDFADRNSVRALELNPNSEAGRLTRAKFLLTTGQPETAHDLLDAILRANPMNTEAVFTQAQVFAQTNQPDRQEAVYRDLIRSRPNCWLAYNDLGNLFHNRGKDDQALGSYSKASALAPRAALPLRNLGTSYLLLGRNAEAKVAFENSILLAPNVTAYENLGTLAFQTKDYPGALKLYLQAQSLAPASFYVLADLGDTYEKLNQPERTQDAYRQAAKLLSVRLQTNPRSAADWMTLAFYHAKTHDPETAEQDIRASEQRATPNVTTAFLKARTLMLIGRSQEAQTIVRSCLAQGLSVTEVELAPEFEAFRIPQQVTKQGSKT